jgi:hypothetical protein
MSWINFKKSKKIPESGMGEMWKYQELLLYLIPRTTGAFNRTST